MEQTRTDARASSVSDFAGFLSSLADPPRDTAEPGGNDDLEDDFATLSYEQALRSHARYRPSAPDADPTVDPPLGFGNDSRAAESTATRSKPVSGVPMEKQNGTLKTASITIRLSEAECAQLRRRAAEAGLTISAYLRSCTLEVESLRAQVKQTLAQLRSTGSATADLPKRARPRTSPQRWWARLWPLFRVAVPLQ
ncbi:MAG TPA: hypothetical protein VGG85_10780 [Terracidiphilus sp.]|jgi:hypothetical protein